MQDDAIVTAIDTSIAATTNDSVTQISSRGYTEIEKQQYSAAEKSSVAFLQSLRNVATAFFGITHRVRSNVSVEEKIPRCSTETIASP